jgi:hypothetical protein
VKGTCKNSLTPSKDQPENCVLKKKRCKQKIRNIFNKIIIKNFPTLEKVLPIQVQAPSMTPNRPNQNRTSSWHIIIKTTSTENKERIMKAIRQEKTNNI